MLLVAALGDVAPSLPTPAWVPLAALAFIAIAVIAVVLAARSRRRPQRGRGGAGRQGLARLEFIYGPLDGQVVPLAHEITTIGSAPGNTVVVPDPAVSRKHVGIRRDPSGAGYEMADLGSTNGVYVNGHRLAKRLLHAGDIIRIGASEMVFQYEKTG